MKQKYKEIIESIQEVYQEEMEGFEIKTSTQLIKIQSLKFSNYIFIMSS